jgi:pyruvate/2-oxoglutarate/acetoin dehydrogenase E1 component
VHRTLNVVDRLAVEGISVEVVDPRTIVPLDKKTIIESVKKTRRLVVVDEDHERCGICSQISAIVSEEALDNPDARIKRVATPTAPIPSSPVL